MEELKLRQQRGPKCHPAGTTGYGNTVEGGVCFVGIAPGADEVVRGTPFTGPSGQLLDAILEAVGYPRELVYTTNLLCWFKNDPTVPEVAECWPRLHDELANLRPKLIIPLGEIATDFILGNSPISLFSHTPSSWSTYAWQQINAATSEWPEGEEYFGFKQRRGRTTWSTTYSAYVMPTFHPSAVLRGNSSIIADIVRALSKIPLIINEYKADGSEAAYDYKVVESIEEGNALLSSLPKGNGRGVALDIETNYGRPDIDWFSEDLLCLSLTWGWNATAVIPGNIAKLLDWRLTEGVNWIGQNFIFDSGGIRRWIGPNLPISEDTMFQSYALDERPGHHDLETIGGEWCAAPMWKSELAKYTVKRKIVTPQGKTITKKVREVPDPALYKYNAGDTTYTYRSFVRQSRAVAADDMEGVYRNLLLPAANAFKEIQYRGIYIDQIRQLELLIEWEEMWLEQEDELNRIVHEADPNMAEDDRLNFRSSQQMTALLYDVLGLPKQYAKQNTRGHATAPRVTTNKEALEALYSYHPFCKLFHEWRQVDHQISTSRGIMERIKIDGMLHAVPMIHGTETGRLSYQNPNIQNMSQDWMVGPNLARIREIFAPRNPSTHFIAEADYKQIELWMAATWSQDAQMYRDLETGDFHRMTAMGVYNKAWDEVTKGDRFFTKRITFGRLYERGAEDLTKGSGGLNCSVKEAEEWIRKWNARYNGYVSWADQLKKQVIADGVIVTPWGRKRRYYLVMGQEAHHQLRSALNFCQQSTAHDYTLTALIQLQSRLARLDSYILIETHDSLLLEISRKYADEAIGLVNEVMTTVRPNSDWPLLKIDWKAGPNWGEAHEPCKDCGKMYPTVCSCAIKELIAA